MWIASDSTTDPFMQARNHDIDGRCKVVRTAQWHVLFVRGPHVPITCVAHVPRTHLRSVVIDNAEQGVPAWAQVACANAAAHMNPNKKKLHPCFAMSACDDCETSRDFFK